MTEVPKEPSGVTTLVQWARTITQILRERTFLHSPDVYVEQTLQGVRIRVKASQVKGGTSSSDKPVWL